MFNKFFTLSVSAFIALVFTAMSFAQVPIFEDNFDSYTAGLGLACQNPIDWTTWGNAPCGPEDGLVTSAQASSGPNSVNIILNNDQLKLFPALYTTGKYSMAFEMYIATGLTGYFNCLSSWNNGSPAWAMQVYFNNGGLGNMDAGGALIQPFTYPHDTWMDIEVICDLDLDVGEFWIDGVMIHTWIWSTGTFGTGELSLEANNFFGGGSDGIPDYYFDNYVVTDLLAVPPGFSDDFDSYTAGVQLVAQNQVDWDTWSGTAGGGEDPFVSDLYSYSGSNSVVEIAGNDFIKRHGDKTTGQWYMSFLFYIPAANSGYFNTMNDFDGTFVWGMDTFFDVGGGGRVDTTGGGGGGANDVTFTWAVGQWNQAIVGIDLDATPPLAELWVGTGPTLPSVATWDWTQGGSKPNMLAVNDFYGGASTDEMYIDDYYFGDTWPTILPVELTSFAANVNDKGDVILNWSTATELNNQMFEIERRSEEGQYSMIGYVNGHGTTSEPQEYSYIDYTVETGTFFYRLKQIDFGGVYDYSDEVEVDVDGPLTFGLEQNYPNPFNPTTHIKYNIPESGIVKLAVYNTLGEEVSVLVDGMVEAGFYEVTLDASNLPSGAYFYRLQSENLTQVKKMLLMK
ncbi:T9SS type A sorting domain-containing protein [Bacteroidota bacterium]